jgi:hypothetical protein
MLELTEACICVLPCARTGFFADKNKTQNCKPCPKGKYAAVSGSSFCEDCEAGRFAGAPESKTCTPAPAGSLFVFPSAFFSGSRGAQVGLLNWVVFCRLFREAAAGLDFHEMPQRPFHSLRGQKVVSRD